MHDRPLVHRYDGLRRRWAVGYGNPPESSRFKKGQSGNLKGRKPGRYREAPFEAIFKRIINIYENGNEKAVTAEEAFLRKILEVGIQGNESAALEMLNAIEEDAERLEREKELMRTRTTVVRPVPEGRVSHHLTNLRVLTKLDRFNETARLKIEPWAVEWALGQMGEGALTNDQQRIVIEATCTPRKVKWPDWWEELP